MPGLALGASFTIYRGGRVGARLIKYYGVREAGRGGVGVCLLPEVL